MKNHDVFVFHNPNDVHCIFNFVQCVSLHMADDDIYLDQISHKFKMPPIQLFMNDTHTSLNNLNATIHNNIIVVIKGSSALADHIYDCINGKKNISDYFPQ